VGRRLCYLAAGTLRSRNPGCAQAKHEDSEDCRWRGFSDDHHELTAKEDETAHRQRRTRAEKDAPVMTRPAEGVVPAACRDKMLNLRHQSAAVAFSP